MGLEGFEKMPFLSTHLRHRSIVSISLIDGALVLYGSKQYLHESIHRKKDRPLVTYSAEYTHPGIHLWSCVHHPCGCQHRPVCFPAHCRDQRFLDVETALVQEKDEITGRFNALADKHQT